MQVGVPKRAVLSLVQLLCAVSVVPFASGQALDSCTIETHADHIQEWKRLTSPEMMGAEGADAGTIVVEGIAKRPIFLGGKTWFPVSAERQTICGTFDDSKVFDVTEFDWNIFIKPAPEFTFVIDPAQLPRKNGLNIENCPTDTAAKCLEVEVGARKEYFQQHTIFNTFLPASLGKSVLRGGPVCVSGPWVQDDNHSQHPEIHPSEQIWWRFPSATGALHLMVAQDASDRFAQKSDFAFETPATPKFRVWSARPVPSRFTVAFSAPTAGNTIFNLEELVRQDVVELAANDTGDLTVRDGADVRLTVRKAAGANRRVKLALDWACRQDDRVIGTFGVTSSVANANGSNPGLYLLRLVPPGTPPLTNPAPQPGAAPKPSDVGIDVVSNSMRRGTVNGRPSLVVDVVLTEVGAAVPTPVKSVRLTQPGGRELPGQPASTPGGTLIKEVPVGTGPASLDVELVTGRSSRVQIPAIGMSARLDDPRPLSPTQADADAAATFGRVAGLWEGNEVPFGRLMRATGWQVEVVPTYGLIKDGRVAAEESSSLTEDLSAAVEKEGPTRQRVFGTQTPFVVTWKVTTRDLSAVGAAPVPPPAPAQVKLAPSPHTGRDGTATIAPPEATPRMVQLDASVSVTDVYGISGTAQTTLWSHYLAGNRETLAQGLISTVARKNDLSPEAIVSPSQRPADRDKRRRAGSLKSLIQMVAGDERLTVDEAQQVLTYARDNATALRK